MARKIVIADDEPNIVTSLEFLMRRSGYEVWIARDGDEVLALVERVLPDLVVLDVMMPRKSGYEVCHRLRERPEFRHVKIVMLTAKGREAEVSRGLAIGADTYVTKPFSTRELMAVIGELLEDGATPGKAGKPS
jgi:DNA-binding response OmpR family regulator